MDSRFLYVDTFKVLSKIHGFDSKRYAYLTPSDLDLLESDLKGGLQVNALYTEFLGNPRLASVDTGRLYLLSEQLGSSSSWMIQLRHRSMLAFSHLVMWCVRARQTCLVEYAMLWEGVRLSIRNRGCTGRFKRFSRNSSLIGTGRRTCQ